MLYSIIPFNWNSLKRSRLVNNEKNTSLSQVLSIALINGRGLVKSI